MSAETKELQVKETQPSDLERVRPTRTFIPRVDIYETGDQVVVVADMPGVDENSVEITVEKNVLTITGSVEPFKPENYGLTYREYEVGNYQRSFTLSRHFDLDKIEATVKNGVVRLWLPKTDVAKSRKITVKAS